MNDLSVDLNEVEETTAAPSAPLVSSDVSRAAANAALIPLSTICLGVICPMASEAGTAIAFVDAVLARCRAAGFKSVEFFAVLDRACKDNTRELLTAHAASNPELNIVWSPDNRGVV